MAGLVVGGTGRPGATDDAPDVTTSSRASTPSALASEPGWANDELARFTDGGWEVRPDAQVLDHIDNPLQRRGEAFAVTWQDEETWLLVDHTLDRRGRPIDSVSSFPARVAMPDLASWVEQMVALQRGESARLLVRFAGGETLTPGDGATILDQRAHPDLPARLEALPGRVFSGKAHIKPDTQAVFFCFGIPGKDNTITDAALDADAWTLAAGRTEWLLLDLQTGKVLEDAAAIDAVIHCEPETPRQCRIAPSTLAEARAKVEKHLKNGHLRQVQAPVGVGPQLIAWMELN